MDAPRGPAAGARYTCGDPDDRRAMLDAIGVESVDELFSAIPEDVRLRRPIDLPAGMTEDAVLGTMRDLAERNVHADREITFLGGGAYDHYVPAVVDAIVSRQEFQTSYTPYQAELSQGNLQAIFEFQTAICELTGLPVANASLYDGPSAAAEAAFLARSATGRNRIVCSRGVDPQTREVLVTVARAWGAEVAEVPLDGGATDPERALEALDDETALLVVSQPNYLGSVEDLAALGAAARRRGALFAVSCDPMTLGILAPPGDFGADIAFGDGQSLGNNLSFGGPAFGFFATSDKHLRRIPGRVVGETKDASGRRGFVLTLQTREQHIRRERATSNICTNQALCALAGTVYLSWLGRRGLAEMGELMLSRTAYLCRRLSEIDGVERLFETPFVREIAVSLDAPVDRVIERCHERGIACGPALGRDYPEYPDAMLIAVTERRSREQIDLLAGVLEESVREARAAVREGSAVC